MEFKNRWQYHKKITNDVDNILENNGFSVTSEVCPDGEDGFAECFLYEGMQPVSMIVFNDYKDCEDYVNYIIKTLETTINLSDRAKGSEMFCDENKYTGCYHVMPSFVLPDVAKANKEKFLKIIEDLKEYGKQEFIVKNTDKNKTQESQNQPQ